MYYVSDIITKSGVHLTEVWYTINMPSFSWSVATKDGICNFKDIIAYIRDYNTNEEIVMSLLEFTDFLENNIIKGLYRVNTSRHIIVFSSTAAKLESVVSYMDTESLKYKLVQRNYDIAEVIGNFSIRYTQKYKGTPDLRPYNIYDWFLDYYKFCLKELGSSLVNVTFDEGSAKVCCGDVVIKFIIKDLVGFKSILAKIALEVF